MSHNPSYWRCGAAIVITACLVPAAYTSLSAPEPGDRAHIENQLDGIYPELESLYKHLHTHPELSFQEEQTGLRVGKEWRAAGFEVTTGVGGHGVVGVLR